MQKIFRRQFLLGVCADMQPAVIHFVHIKRGGEEVRRWHAYFRKWLDVVCQQIWDRRQVLCTHSTQSTKIRHVPNKFQEPDELSTKSASPSASPHSIPGSCAWYQELNFLGGMRGGGSALLTPWHPVTHVTTGHVPSWRLRLGVTSSRREEKPFWCCDLPDPWGSFQGRRLA